ncbi:hypothetical protein AD006_28930 (plasmid) [Pseudonocardia sp. EC080610-09]|nr:hypothetical protein AD006_28930 [Pseudonocardia sp. EC080610-09]ALL85298.1 hypothetical protein AD017_29320 [Pseudonocardia sp. EC080619-01]
MSGSRGSPGSSSTALIWRSTGRFQSWPLTPFIARSARVRKAPGTMMSLTSSRTPVTATIAHTVALRVAGQVELGGLVLPRGVGPGVGEHGARGRRGGWGVGERGGLRLQPGGPGAD